MSSQQTELGFNVLCFCSFCESPTQTLPPLPYTPCLLSLHVFVLQAARQKIQTLETSVENFLSRESKMKHMIRSLEQERSAHQKTIERMRTCLPPDTLTDVEMTQIKTGANGKAKTAAKKP